MSVPSVTDAFPLRELIDALSAYEAVTDNLPLSQERLRRRVTISHLRAYEMSRMISKQLTKLRLVKA